MQPVIAVTMGDPAGVGPELCLRLLQLPHVHEICQPIIYGDRSLLSRVARQLGWPEPAAEWVRDIPGLDAVAPGRIAAPCGEASYRYVCQAIEDALAGRVAAICTGPIHKEAWHQAGVPYPGHTELLADKTRSPFTCMMLTSEAITCSLVTGHVGYGEVPRLLSVESILQTIRLTARAMRRLRQREVRLVVCGLNPHAGEHGLFGDQEEERFIAPAVSQAAHEGYRVEGPLSPDTAFIRSLRQRTDAYICMYHDQGLIPLKALAFEEAVNVTLGLPIVRTSVDHGTAFDIAWKGVAEVSSLVRAVELAARLAEGRLRDPFPSSGV
ncbi:4-hydroxythreonine-4-phosphate dehydrogenase PdxA [Thermogemmata fonticola]|jgi:4-hydroxythreonine-4-phosphate dehydrogenase|nr:4-hydroxythreonine-4-phosphate dehydrogenase PdxA [Thermogemmata fonticola]